MSNVVEIKPRKSTITLSDGVEREVKLDLNAMAELEDKYGSVEAAFQALENNSVKAIRFVLWAALLHNDENLTEQQVGRLIDLQNMGTIMDSLGKAFTNDMPSEDETGKSLPNE